MHQRLPEMGDGSIRGGVASGISPFIHAQQAQQAQQPEMGMQMRGSSAAAAMLQLNTVPAWPGAVYSVQLCVPRLCTLCI